MKIRVGPRPTVIRNSAGMPARLSAKFALRTHEKKSRVKEPEPEEFPWFALHARLEAIASFTKTRHAAFVRGLEQLPAAQRREMAMKYVCSFDEEIRAAMASWKTGLPMPKLEGEALSFLRFRAMTSATFVLAL